MTEWTKVEDGLPEKHKEVLLNWHICDKRFNPRDFVYVGWFDGNQFHSRKSVRNIPTATWGKITYKWVVSHWMPLPAPPKEA